MILDSKLTPLTIDYPDRAKIPENLLNTELAKEFRSNSRIFPFLEQFGNETRPHSIRHIKYQYGTIRKRKATMLFYMQKPFRLFFTDESDPLCTNQDTNGSTKIKFPKNTVSSMFARTLREKALKWIAEKFFEGLDYLAFDEPILDHVNPDLLVVPVKEASTILQLPHIAEINNNSSNVEVELKNSIFVEIKAYHGSTIVGEKEVLQAYNYAMRGGKTFLLSSGTLGTLDCLDILNNASRPLKAEDNYYDKEIYDEFTRAVKEKFRQKIKQIDMSATQDAFDTRGIYISAATKIKKMHKYTEKWDSKIEYEILSSPDAIMAFLKSPIKLGIIEPSAFKELLSIRGMKNLAKLFDNLQKSYLEQIILDPTLLYPFAE